MALKPSCFLKLFPLLLLMACSGKPAPAPAPAAVKTDSQKTAPAAAGNPAPKDSAARNPAVLTAVPKTATDSFLLRPFDFQAYKKKKGQSNSGGSSSRSYYFHPAYKGFYLGFFLFGRSDGYRLPDKKDTLLLENGMDMVTYKPRGKNENMYLDPDEEMIALDARFNDFDLPELAYIGARKKAVEQAFGAPAFEKREWMGYGWSDRILLFQCRNDRVIFLRYAHLNKDWSLQKDNPDLYKTE